MENSLSKKDIYINLMEIAGYICAEGGALDLACKLLSKI